MSYSGITLALSKGRIFDETLPLLAVEWARELPGCARIFFRARKFES